MSIIQIQLEDHRAWCAIDTRVLEGADAWEASKMAAIPHTCSLMAARGGSLAFSLLLPCAFMDPRASDFDGLAANIPTFVNQLSPGVPASMDAEFELFVIGWSSTGGRMEAAHFEIDLRRNEVTRRPVSRCLIAPDRANSADTRFPGLATDADMHAVAREQLQWIADRSPADVTGGRLLVAEVTRREIRLRDTGPIAPPDVSRAA